MIEPDFTSEKVHAGALAERIHDRHRLPVAEAISRGEISREWFAGVNPALNEDEIEPFARRAERVFPQPERGKRQRRQRIRLALRVAGIRG